MLSVSRFSRHTHVLPAVASSLQRDCCLRQQRRGLRAGPVSRWKKALLYPPNVDHVDHHLHLPTLKQYQDELEAIHNPVHINDIGLSEELYLASAGPAPSEPVAVPRSSRKGISDGKAALPEIDASGLAPESLVQLVDVAISKKQLNYDQLRTDWMRSEEGKRDTLLLAHHYHIYRDLFSSPSQHPFVDPVPKVTMPKFKPYPDRIMHDLFRDWFPGAVRYKMPDPRPIYHFTPHVPIHAEFAVSEVKIAQEEEQDVSKVDPDSVIISPVHRGNLITPLYASAKPSVVIDARTGSSSCDKVTDALLNDKISLLTDKSDGHMYTLALLNLDSTLGDEKPVCHWMVSNISRQGGCQQEVMPFMPVYGIRGLGYHRFAFLLMRHAKPITVDAVPDFVFPHRLLDPLDFLQSHEATPIGLSWFQSTWDPYTQKVFHNQLNMKSPVYEYQAPPMTLMKQVKHPFAAPFNVYLDNFRDPKELNKEVLLDRLKDLNPFDYSKQYEVDPLPNAYGEIRDIQPTWIQATVWKRRNRVNQFRGLRPASARIPLNNNPDLDFPIWPPPRRNSILNKFPEYVKRPKPLRVTKWILPPNEHPQYRVDHVDLHEINEKAAKDRD